MTLNLRIEEIPDPIVRDNFQRIEEWFRTLPLLKGTWRFIEINVDKAEANLKIPHRLRFKPTDVIMTSKTGSGDVTWHYDLFDRTKIEITTTGPCVIRAFVGSHLD